MFSYDGHWNNYQRFCVTTQTCPNKMRESFRTFFDLMIQDFNYTAWHWEPRFEDGDSHLELKYTEKFEIFEDNCEIKLNIWEASLILSPAVIKWRSRMFILAIALFVFVDFLLFVGSVVGNFIIIFVIVRYKKVQTKSNDLILSVAFADLLIGLFGVPLFLVKVSVLWQLLVKFCVKVLLCFELLNLFLSNISAIH